MNRLLFSFSILGTILLILSCTGSKESSLSINIPEGTVGLVGDQYISLNELKENYISGVTDKEYTQQDLIDFLPVYLDYKGKLLDAEAIGYFNDDRIQDEFQLYSKQAAYAFWMEEEIKPTKFNEFKQRYMVELKSKHILIAVQQSASPEDTLEAYKKIMAARDEFLQGKSLEELDMEYSTKRNGRSMGGDLPWFSVGSTVAEFENALYSLEINEISMPVRTQFGYHIILLEDKRVRKSSRQISHIFVRRNSDQTKIFNAYTALNDSSSWKNVVVKYSEDTPSIQNNGLIGWVNYGSRYNSAFIDSVMNIDTSLPYTKPIETTYGYHIFRIDSIQTFKDEVAKNEHIMELLENSTTFTESNEYVIDYIVKKYNAITFDNNLDAFKAEISIEDTLKFSEVSIPDSVLTLPLFRIKSFEFKISDFKNYLIDSYPNYSNKQFSNRWLARFIEAKVDEQLTALTLEEYPDFKNQTNNFKNGLVVYQMNEDSVWSSATIDTTMLLQIYSDNIQNYQYEERFYYYMITSSRDSSLDRAIKFIEEGNSPDSLFARGFRVGVNSDSTGVFKGEPFDMLTTMKIGEISDRFEYSNRKGHFILMDKLPARSMTFDEAFNRLVSEIQPTREQKWLERIRETYNITQFPNVIIDHFIIDKTIE
jgi:peptidyl-prolyl cis-trans isomerase SurA